MSAPAAAARAFRGAILDFSGDPRSGGVGATRYLEDGLLVVRDGKVVSVGAAAQALAMLPPGIAVTDYSGRLLVPGFIDAHVHYSQTDVIASAGEQLLGWLENHTFPAESRFGDAAHADATAEFFLDELLRNGTTSAAVFATVHPQSVDSLFGAAERRRMRIISGKVMMDCNCPEFLRDEAQSSYEESLGLARKWHGRDRLLYAVTPRFAATSSERQLELAGRLLDEIPGLLMQTHLAENVAEVEWIKKLFPWSTSYLHVYERFGLVRPGAMFAHCIHLDADAWARFARAGATAVHCPTSNLFLGSGLFDARLAGRAGAHIALGTDVGGGTSFSMLRTMHEAYKVAQMRGDNLSSLECFYWATLGAAQALGLQDRIGSFRPGCEADFTVLRSDATPLMARRMERAQSTEEKLFVLLMLGDEHAVEATHVLGEAAYVSRRAGRE